MVCFIYVVVFFFICFCFFFLKAEDGIRFLVRSRGLGDVYKRQDIIFDRRVKEFHAPANPEV